MPFVTDTHSLVWHLADDSNLSEKAKEVFLRADSFEEQVFIPCIVFFELVYLIEKKKIAISFDSFVSLISAAENYKVEPLCIPIIRASQQISRKKIKDPWDRIIAATSMHLNFPLITRDKKLKKVGIQTVW